METCPNCRRSFPDGALMNVFISRNNNFTQELLCKKCAAKATEGLHTMGFKSKGKKKWWQIWK